LKKHDFDEKGDYVKLEYRFQKPYSVGPIYLELG